MGFQKPNFGRGKKVGMEPNSPREPFVPILGPFGYEEMFKWFPLRNKGLKNPMELEKKIPGEGRNQ